MTDSTYRKEATVPATTTVSTPTLKLIVARLDVVLRELREIGDSLETTHETEREATDGD